METNLPTIAGFVSTALFALGTLPMLTKAYKSKNLGSYSLGNILMSNVGNLIYAIYVFQLPPGPVWVLYIYNLVSTALMLIWYLRYEGLPQWLRSSSHQAKPRFLSLLCCSPAL
ncbi:MAG: hypothetical protein EHM70_15225 [Chloroflexota bacterium]|nr:MAG: hypothetical protein EHM70_15225 [Chloroflexota bacterium]